ncbi:MAG: dihydroorotase [Bacteroidaceae bacterium]|nr:dihydroorotase [Bacteroidaceae bacterium]
MKRTLIHNAIIVNDGVQKQGSVLIEDGVIAQVLTDEKPLTLPYTDFIDATGCYLLPGVIDEHVHFRDPGLTHKADIRTESMAAAAGGVTSIMDMPNTMPQTTTLEAWEQKMELMAQKSVVNYACFFGATNTNYNLLRKLDRHRTPGVKLFMGSSTGGMLVDRTESLKRVFGGTDQVIMAHCEDQHIINENTQKYRGEHLDLPIWMHRIIRSSEACYQSTKLAVELATEAGARLHIAHLSTARELALLSSEPMYKKKITAEACIAHLMFSEEDYKKLGSLIKCNPSVKRKADKVALRMALSSGKIDTIATDHAPHTWEEKYGEALHATSGMPMVQFSLLCMLELVDEGVMSIEALVEKMCHAPARLFGIDRRGYIEKGAWADLVLVRKGGAWEVMPEMILSKCGWSPLTGHSFRWRVEKTFCNGHQVYDGKSVDETKKGEALWFNF